MNLGFGVIIVGGFGMLFLIAYRYDRAAKATKPSSKILRHDNDVTRWLNRLYDHQDTIADELDDVWRDVHDLRHDNGVTRGLDHLYDHQDTIADELDDMWSDVHDLKKALSDHVGRDVK